MLLYSIYNKDNDKDDISKIIPKLNNKRQS